MKVLPFLVNQLGITLGESVKNPNDETNPFYKIVAEVRYLETDVTSQTLTGPEKKAEVINRLENIGLDVGSLIFNLLVELAVFWIKSKI